MSDDICGFCGKSGADKIPYPVRWPNEQDAGTEFVHSECEMEEQERASSQFQGEVRNKFLSAL